MPDDKRKRGQDAKLISLTQEWERAWWCKKLGVSRSRLRVAVKAVGPSARKVRAWLKERA